MSKTVGVPIIAFCLQDDNVAAINAILRKAGMPVHCKRVQRLNELSKELRKQPPEMLIIFDEEKRADLDAVKKILSKLSPSPPFLLARTKITEQSISDAMDNGARDVVSLAHERRFQSVVNRELQNHRMQIALSGVTDSAKRYKSELKSLMRASVEAIADVQEGIVVAVNLTWIELFGYRNEDELTAVPFMDLCDEADQPMLKGALVACLREKWGGEALKIKARRENGSVAPIEVTLERIMIDDGPAVRVTVPGEQEKSSNPVQLLEQAVLKDPATGLYHRNFFLEKVEEKIHTPLSGGVRAIVYIRPDSFSGVHDEIGILGTELLLTQLADQLREFMQPADLYGRFGGTVFVAILERGTMNDVEAWAEQLRRAIADHLFEIDDASTSITCTIGLSEFEHSESSMSQVFSGVEKACRAGRRAGGNRVHLTEVTHETRALRQEDAFWGPKIESALRQKGFRLVHQPISSLNEEIDGVFDTRVQMLRADSGPALAGEFIPTAERMNLIKGIDRWVIDASFKFCKKKNPALVFIRLSADSIADRSLLKWLRAQIKRSRLKPSQFCFQISERVATKHLRVATAVAKELQDDGFNFAVDHVGGAKDPDKLLKHVPMQYLKIDGSLMQGLHRNTDLQTQVRQIAELATNHGVKTIAERVEDANTMAVLWQLGISFIQGNYVQMHGVVLEDTDTTPDLAAL